jgi:hypothetical protein
MLLSGRMDVMKVRVVWRMMRRAGVYYQRCEEFEGNS